MKTATTAASAVLLMTAALPVLAQDSVSKLQALPGDAVAPWDDASAAFGSEQSNRYVVDMATFNSSWGTEFAIAPISKSSRSGSLNFNSLLSAQAVSSTLATNVSTSDSYSSWNGVGFGVNNDPAVNDAGTPVAFPTAYGSRFGTGYAEFATTDAGDTYNGIISGIVHFDPLDPKRLYVNRVVAAINGCDEASNVADTGFGAVLNDGTVAFRADSFGASGSSSCANVPVTGNNIYLVNGSLRDPNSLNVISGTLASGHDAAATKWVIRADGTTYNTPNVGVIAGENAFIGTNFNDQFSSGPDFGFPFPSSAHLGTASSQRGNLARLERDFSLLNSTGGLCAIIGRNASNVADQLIVFGLTENFGGIGTVSGTLNLVLPATVTDNSTGFVNLVGATLTNDFAHYSSQVAFRGGNGQVGMNVDKNGNLIVAATVDQGDLANLSSNPLNYVAVARVSPTGSVEWTMAGYNDAIGGKPVLDGPGGAPIGQLIPLSVITGVDLPSSSCPMVDSAGNVYFWAAFERFSTGSTSTGLIRAVYDEATFSYELELLFTLGYVFPGINSGVDYQVRFVSLADTNSISSSAPFSGNISEDGYAGQRYPGAPNSSVLHLGGLVLGAEIVYDVNGDGAFDDASNPANPGSPDEDYQVLLYVSGTEAAQPSLGSQGPGESVLTVTGTGLGSGESSVVTLSGAPANSLAVLSVAAAGLPDLPLFGGVFVSGFGNLLLQNFFTDANGQVSLSINGNANQLDLVLQFASVDLSLPAGQFSISNAVLARFGQ